MNSVIKFFIKNLTAALVIFGSSTLAHGGEEPPPVEKLLKDAEQARGGSNDGLSWEMTIDSIENGTTAQIRYSVRARGTKALVEVLEPEKKKGELYLFKDNRILYMKPSLKKPVATSSRQKLTGNASNGDIAIVNYLGDYNGKIVGEEALQGTDTWVLDLKAKNKMVTYDAIKLWITKKDHLAIKADYLTLNGDVSKTLAAEYKNTLASAGKSSPFVSNIIIINPATPANKTSVSYKSPRTEKHAETLFTLSSKTAR